MLEPSSALSTEKLTRKLTNTCMDPQTGYVQDASSPYVRIAWAGQSVEIRLLDFDPNISADRWPDDVRLSDLEPHFVCQACGQRGADIRPDFDWDKESKAVRAYKRCERYL